MKKSLVTFIAFFFTVSLLAQKNARINYEECKVPHFQLPELMLGNDGKIIKSIADWEQVRRPEILKMFMEYEYGYTPARKIPVKYQVLSECSDFLGGKATMRQVKFSFTNNGKKIESVLLLLLPNHRKGKCPVFVVYNFLGNHSLCNDTRIEFPVSFSFLKEKDDPLWNRGGRTERWPLCKIFDRGYAIATMCYTDIQPDDFENREHGIESLFPPFHRLMQDCNEWGAIGAWAWGSSRILDYLETDERIDINRVAIMGHSRLGKAALWAGAQDQRFKVVISNDSGCSGAALSKRVVGENLCWITCRFKHWFCPAYGQFANNEEKLPFDQHELLALIAPRHLYVASAEGDKWADPRGEYLGAYYASEVYRLYGLKGLESINMPNIHQPVQIT